MSNFPIALCDSSLTLFHLAISSSDPWPFSLSLSLSLSLQFPLIKKQELRTYVRKKSMGHHNNIIKKEHELPPKGCMAVRVGQEQERFVVPVVYLNHPLFIGLLKEAEEEYGFDHRGAITIPCHVEHFRHVQGIIDRDTRRYVGLGNHGHHHHHLPFHLCFKA